MTRPIPANLLDRTRAALNRAIGVYRGTADEPQLVAIRDRLDEPLRVAIAGRAKAGKSTLLNALVGERLAPTDTGECTRVVTWYADGHTYRVTAHVADQPPVQLRFSRDDGAIEIDLAGRAPEEIDHLTVIWPSQALRTTTLVDTPGIGSLTDRVSRRSWDLLAADGAEEEAMPTDAVLYLMRHVHASDMEFLKAFRDSEVSRPNPINAIGVLSRADEIGVGRIDSMASAQRIASHLTMDPRMRRMVQTVVPVAGLLAETAATLTEAEMERLRRIANLAPRDVEALLLSADRFRESTPELGLTRIERDVLLARFGLFGLRLAAAIVRQRVVRTAGELARELSARSGLVELRAVLGSLFFERRDVLKSRSALLAIDALTRTRPAPGSEATAAEVEEILAGAHPFSELRVLTSVRAGWVTGKPAVIDDLERLIGGQGVAPHVRVGLEPDASPQELTSAVHAALERWQIRCESPMTSREMAIAGRIAVRSCEGMLASLTGGGRGE